MIVFILVFIASLCGSTVNFLLRKNLDKGGTASGYMVVHFTLSLITALVMTSSFDLSREGALQMLIVGGITGILASMVMVFTSKALACGPSGLTFSFQNGSTVLPAFLLFGIFGYEYNFSISLGLVIGICLVLLGLFWAAYRAGHTGERISNKWKVYAIAMLLTQAVTLAMFQWRCLLTDFSLPYHPLIPFKCLPENDALFMPGMFIAASLFQLSSFVFKERRLLKMPELLCGGIGGLANACSTICLLTASSWATASEKGILFPAFAISVIIICNLWGQKLYGEKVHWLANGVCASGILIAALI